jgi:hypothetical protein
MKRRMRRRAGFGAARLGIGVLAVSVFLLTGCEASSRRPSQHAAPSASAISTQPSSSAPPAVQSAAPCADQGCTPGSNIAVGNGFSVRLWLDPTPSPTDQVSAAATPVVELIQGDAVADWYTANLGSAWSATLICSSRALPTPVCVLTSSEGAHAGSAEFVQLEKGKLVSSPRARVLFDTGAPHAADLDRDGVPDVVGVDNTYQPNYANGQNYWATYRFSDGVLTETGCANQTNIRQEPPRALLTGPCPKTPGGRN